MAYPAVDPQPDFPRLEEAVLRRWADEETFERSVEARPAGEAAANEFVFYEGPPFANGLPHYGHLLTGFVKDVVPRYQTMRGRRVERRFGWDCHGLPAEVEAERELGIAGHPEITRYGIDRFNEACRTSVLRYTDEWRRYVTRQARWVDFDDDYKTLDAPYMESVMWAFKTLWDKGLIYEGFRVLAYCWRCETPLSNTETRMDDVYRDRQDPALTVAFELETGERVLAWTTTPWTLPSNLALAVNSEVDYAVVLHADGHRYVIAEARLGAYERELGSAERVGTLRGSELAGRTYRPLMPYFAGTENAFRILPAEFVTVDDGTGIVHLAPGFGEDDQVACTAAGIPTLCPMDEHGRYTSEIVDWQGTHVFEANPEVIRHLKDRGVALRHETYDHPYPHCWRCSEPLFYRAISSWFVEVTRFKDRMVELNQQINWVPSHIKDGMFGKWLANARDWSISRNRFWGSPIPVWKSDDPAHPRIDVYGSIEELRRDFGVEVTDLHRPSIDGLVRPNPDDPSGTSMMRRVPEVLDCWFESGSMPFAQVHYPFETREWFESHYPGDFIVEYIGQTRGWFYTLHVLATALFDRPAFTNCVSHGIVLGDDGAKMSKSLRNYPDPMGIFESHGADAMRWYLMSSPILRGGDFSVTEQGMRDTVRQVLLPMWNSWYFLALYANAETKQGRVRTDSTDVLDRYVLAKLHRTVATVTSQMDAYDLSGACAEIRTFLDVLTNWYIRRSRDRFWAGNDDAIDTLHTTLSILTRLVAPLLPMVADEIHRGLAPDSPSVHLLGWPSPEELPSDGDLVTAMDTVRDACSAALSVRKAHGRRVRLPLATMTVAAPGAERLADFELIIAEEVNVRAVVLTSDVDSAATRELQVVPAVLGPRLGGRTQQVIAAVKRGEWVEQDGAVVAAGERLGEGEYALRLVAREGDASAPLEAGSGIVLLDVSIDEDLEAEGTARDVVRAVQQARRGANLRVTDRIALVISADDEVRSRVESHRELVAGETLTISLVWDENLPRTIEIDGHRIGVSVSATV
ncbi:MAG: isoleucine--tRNA ligase [Actinomycetota bacterium]